MGCELTFATSQGEYESLCDQMISHYQLAARHHNMNRFEDEKTAIKAGLAAFRRAVKIDPTGLQAYLHQGVFFQNSHRFDESIAIWQTVRPLLSNAPGLSPTGGSWDSFVDGRETVARIGRAAIARDAAYQSGQGNLTTALTHALELVRIAPLAPHFLFEAGTISWVAAKDRDAVNEARALLERSGEAAMLAATAFLRRDGARRSGDWNGEAACPGHHELITVHTLSTLATTSADGKRGDHRVGGLRVQLTAAEDHARTAFVATLTGRAGLYGEEGVVASKQDSSSAGDGSCALHIFGSASWPFLGLHKAFWLSQETWRADRAVALFDYTKRGGSSSSDPPQWMQHGPQPAKRTTARVASLVGYASTEFYHFVLEALPRLALLLPDLEADPGLQLAVPVKRTQLRDRSGFAARLLSLTLPAHIYKTRLLSCAFHEVSYARCRPHRNQLPHVRRC